MRTVFENENIAVDRINDNLLANSYIGSNENKYRKYLNFFVQL